MFQYLTHTHCNICSCAGNEKNFGGWSASTIRAAGICDEHFLSTAFNSDRNGKRCLRQKEVPVPHVAVLLPSHNGNLQANMNHLQEEPRHPALVEDEDPSAMVIDSEAEQQQNIGKNRVSDVCMERNNVETCICDSDEHSLIVRENVNDKTYPSGRDIFAKFEEVETDESYLNFEPLAGNIESIKNNNVNEALEKKQEVCKNTSPCLQTDNSKLSPAYILSLENQLKNVTEKLELCRKELHNTKMRSNRLQKRLDSELKNKVESVDDFLRDKKISEFSKTMIRLQFKKVGIPYTKNEKDLCKIMYYYSASNYNQLRKLGIGLAASSTVRGWVSEYDVVPGLNPVVLQELEKKIESLPPNERVCALKFDELGIKSQEEYSKKFDLIEGVCDMGENRRSAPIAKHALIFCLDSINAVNNWRQTISFGFNENGASATELHDILRETLTALFKIGADVRLIVCDQGPNNQTLFNKFLVITVDRPYFFHLDKKIFAIYDWPHLIKRLVAQLRSHNRIYVRNSEGVEEIMIDFKDLKGVWKFDSDLITSNVLAFLNENNFTPSTFSVMNVALAMKVLSRRMAQAIKTAGEGMELASDTWEASVKFVETLDAVIDACNSYSLKNVEKQKRPLSAENPEILQRMQDFIPWSKKWYTKLVITNENTQKTYLRDNRPPCFIGLPMTVTGLIQLYESLKSQFPGYKLATGLCNQDNLEHLNSKIRGRGGFNPNPTCRMVRLTVRHILSTDFIDTTGRGNVNVEESHSLLNSSLNAPTETANSKATASGELCTKDSHAIEFPEFSEYEENEMREIEDLLEYANSMESFEPLGDNDFIDFENKGYFERNAITYLSGYVCRKSLKKVACSDCEKVFMKSSNEELNENENYTKHREYPHAKPDLPPIHYLTRPTDYFTKIVTWQLQVFHKHYESVWHQRKLLATLVEIAETYTNEKFPGWFEKNHKCYDHRINALRNLFLVRIFKKTNERNHTRKQSDQSTLATNDTKLKKLKHI